MVASGQKISFWPDGNTSPGNLVFDQMATPVPEIMDGSLYLSLEQKEHC
jgi:hypothetical protein